MRAPALLYLLAMAATAPACAATPCEDGECAPGASDSSWDEERELELPSRRMAEGGVRMAEGDVVEIAFGTDGPSITWNVHSHEGDERPKLSQGREAEGTIDFVAPYDGVFWSLWVNDQGEQTTVDVRYRMHGSSTFYGWRDDVTE